MYTHMLILEAFSNLRPFMKTSEGWKSTQDFLCSVYMFLNESLKP